MMAQGISACCGLRTGDQPQDGQGAWHYCASDAPRPRRRGDRM